MAHRDEGRSASSSETAGTLSDRVPGGKTRICIVEFARTGDRDITTGSNHRLKEKEWKYSALAQQLLNQMYLEQIVM